MSQTIMRDVQWLEGRLKNLWDRYYNDVPIGFPVCVKFGPKARYRYGSIYSRGPQCYILINRLFAHPDVPEYVVDATLAHELAHYVHGYGSGLRKLHAHPHRGGVVDKEMQKRGCLFLEEKAAAWRRDHWQSFYIAQTSEKLERRAAHEKQQQTRWEMYLQTPGFRTEESLNTRLSDLLPRFGLSEAPFQVDWLLASIRRNGLSYRFRQAGTVRLHATLADPAVPDAVIDYELSYWLAVHVDGARWRAVEEAIQKAGIWPQAQQAIQWRRNVWPHYYLANHPLKAK